MPQVRNSRIVVSIMRKGMRKHEIMKDAVDLPVVLPDKPGNLKGSGRRRGEPQAVGHRSPAVTPQSACPGGGQGPAHPCVHRTALAAPGSTARGTRPQLAAPPRCAGRLRVVRRNGHLATHAPAGRQGEAPQHTKQHACNSFNAAAGRTFEVWQAQGCTDHGDQRHSLWQRAALHVQDAPAVAARHVEPTHLQQGGRRPGRKTKCQPQRLSSTCAA